METVPSLEACRICANFYLTSSEVDFLNLFEPTQPLQNELVFIEAELRAWQLNITCNDGLPQRICANCFTKFCSIFAFRQECMEAQQKLLQAFVEGDCAEEVVTAQESMMNGMLLADGQVESEVIVGLDSSIPEGHQEEIVTATDEDFAYLQNQHIPEAQNLELPVKSELVHTENMMQPTHIAMPQRKTPEVAFASEAEHISQNKAMGQEMEAIVAQDLEEVLQGNYIPKQSTNKETQPTKSMNLNSDEDDDNSYALSDGSSQEDDENAHPHAAVNPLACQYCYATEHVPIIFPTVEALSQHFFDAHDPTFPYTCPSCPQNFNNSKLRMQHVQQEHSQLKMRAKCQYCSKPLQGFSQKEHMENCQYIGDWECEACGLQLKQITHFAYRMHFRREHANQKKQFKCTTCGRVFTQRLQWEDHKAMHARNSVLWCNECKEAFSDSYELKKHKYKEHNGALPVNCDYCNKSFVTYAFLNRHVQHFHPDKLEDGENVQMKCTNCDVEFDSLHKLRNHQQRPRDENGQCINTMVGKRRRPLTNTGLYPCPFCSKRFHMKTQLHLHLKSHDASKRPYKCGKCHIMCRTPSELKQHENVAHLHIKTFVCEECGKKFGYKKDLRDHMLHHQVTEAPCPEPGCGYICKNDKVLNDHIRHKHRLLPCEYCNETFTRHRLTLHLRNVHKEEIGEEMEKMTSEAQEKVVVEFMTERQNNEIVLNEQPAHQYPATTSPCNNAYEDYATEQVVELDHEIIVT